MCLTLFFVLVLILTKTLPFIPVYTSYTQSIHIFGLVYAQISPFYDRCYTIHIRKPMFCFVLKAYCLPIIGEYAMKRCCFDLKNLTIVTGS
jgi:hypothetical protein